MAHRTTWLRSDLPEAAHLGDLLRLLVRPGVVGHSTLNGCPPRIRFLWFSRTIRASPSNKGLPMKLGCSSGFRTISRGEPNSMVLWSIVDPELSQHPVVPPQTAAAICCQTAHNSLRRNDEHWLRTLDRALSPFRGEGMKSVKRKRDLFPGSRTVSHRSV